MGTSTIANKGKSLMRKLKRRAGAEFAGKRFRGSGPCYGVARLRIDRNIKNLMREGPVCTLRRSLGDAGVGMV